MKGRIRFRGPLVAVSLIAALGIGGLIGWVASARMGGSGQLVPFFIASDKQQMASQVSFAAGFTPVVKSATPAVVNISSSKIVRAPQEKGPSPFFRNPLFRDFFGEDFFEQFDIPRERREHSLGSGSLSVPKATSSPTIMLLLARVKSRLF
ncbi:MAG: hypothetical protein L0387_24180 [Acidobacteria bacterium]|nr:hypothetical protein [Acidobacteriota bacterium]MCI0717906.1 hypothetical protein [Acidobacteriota bacterium]